MGASICKHLEKTGQSCAHANIFMSLTAVFTATAACLLPDLICWVSCLNNVLTALVLKQRKVHSKNKTKQFSGMSPVLSTSVGLWEQDKGSSSESESESRSMRELEGLVAILTEVEECW